MTTRPSAPRQSRPFLSAIRSLSRTLQAKNPLTEILSDLLAIVEKDTDGCLAADGLPCGLSSDVVSSFAFVMQDGLHQATTDGELSARLSIADLFEAALDRWMKTAPSQTIGLSLILDARADLQDSIDQFRFSLAEASVFDSPCSRPSIAFRR